MTDVATAPKSLSPMNPGILMDLRCQTCRVTARQTVNAARGLGWRIWDGTTLGGSVQSVRFCPRCCGNGPDEDDAKPSGWDAVCHTCDERFSESWDTDEPDEGGSVYTKDDARRWERDHQCETDVELIDPARGKSS